MIQTRAHIRKFQGVLLVLSIVGSLFAFQGFASPSNERAERVRTEWVASRKTVRKNIVAARHPAPLLYPTDHRLAELNYSRRIKTRTALDTPSETPRDVLPRKTIAGLSEEDHIFCL